MRLTKKSRKIPKQLTIEELPEPYPFKKKLVYIDEDKLPAKIKEMNEILKKTKFLPE